MKLLRFTLLLVAFLAGGGTLLAQAGASGTILGTVTDSTGAIVAGAAVKITNTATGVAARATTSSSGDFSVPSLNPGSYSVAITAPGFEQSVTNGFTLAVDQKVRIDVALKPGAVTDTVQVAAQGLALDTDSSAISQLVSQKQVQELPLNGRNFMQLLLLGAGAVTVGGEQGTMRQGAGNAVSINGARPESNNYTLDGLINTDTALVTPAVILSQDAIQEFKVLSGTYSAEYGFSANQINIISKSGTNHFHGTLFEFDRNNAFDAKPFATATDYSAGVPTSNPVLRQNQFGFVLSGPVVLPKLYDGRNNLSGWPTTRAGASTTVPSPTPPSPTLPHSPATSPPSRCRLTAPPPAPLASTSIRTACPWIPPPASPFPGNKIPAGRITNRLGQVAVSYGLFGTPNAGGPNVLPGTLNFIQGVGLPLTTNQQTYRGDQALGKFGNLFGRFTYSTYANSSLNTSSLVYGIETQFETQKNWEISHTISLGGSKVNNFRFGYLDAQAPQGAATPPAAAVTALGESGTLTKFGPLQLTWPNVNLSQYSGVGGPGNAYTGSDQPAWEFADSFSMVKGKHTLSIGADYRRWRLIRNLDDDFLGDWNFNAATILTNNINCPNPTGECGTGNSVADLLLGYYGSAAGYQPGPLSPTDQAGNPQTHIFSYFAPYVQDDWKIKQRLTLNIGLRWDYRAAAYEAQNHFFWLDDTNPLGGLCYADKTLSTNGVAPGVGLNGSAILRYCGSNVPRSAPKTPFAPRFGFAYRLPDEKTVIRGGYGIFWDSSEGREIDDSGDIYPYSIRSSLSPTNNPAAPKFGNQLFPSYNTLGPFPASSLTFLAVIESDNPLDPYVQQRTLSIERELSHSTTAEINYIGTNAIHLLDRRQIAQPNDISAANLPFCQANPKDVTHLCPTNTRLPYPNFPGTFINSDWHGTSNYNALNLKLEHRTSSLALTAIYTWAKSLDAKSAAAGVGATGSGYQGFEDNHNPKLDYGPSDFDVDHRFVTSFVYELPVGHGKKFLASSNRAAELATGGWEVTGITTFQTGFPFGIGASDASGLLGTAGQRANYVPGCDIHGGLTQKFQRLNMSCFTQPAIGTYGNTSRNFLRQPGLSNFDLGVNKTFNFTERIHFGFRLDTFNAFNHHQYAVNVGGLATSGSGGGSSIDNGLGDTYQGLITSSSPARILQLSGKLTF